MFTFSPMPTFHGNHSWECYRPPHPSPLSSPPRPVSSPLSPVDNNSRTLSHGPFSSPISAPKFKYASRPTRQVPTSQSREQGRETRRSLFLRNVRNRADDKAWERRAIEGHDLRNFYDEQQIMFQQTERDLADVIFEATPDDMIDSNPQETGHVGSVESSMVDIIAQQEEMELEALVASYQEVSQPPAQTAFPSQPPSPSYIDGDDDYDAIFMDLLPDSPAQQHTDDHMDTCGN